MKDDSKLGNLNPNDGGVLSCFNENGINIGITYADELGEVITIIECRKNGIPIGPQWAWYINGDRYYYNLWAYDGSGRILKWRTWNRRGIENGSDVSLICSLCEKKIATDNMCRLGCWHRFHYECISDHVKTTNTCPTCDKEIYHAMSPKNARWLCRAIARNFKYKNLVLIEDIFGNSMWLKCSFQFELPNFSHAKHVDVLLPEAEELDFFYDSKVAVLLITKKGKNIEKLYMGNVQPIGDMKTFELEHENVLKQRNLLSNPLLLTMISKKHFFH